jgi:fatty acid desaturase
MLIILFYVCFAALTWNWALLPWWIALPAAAYLTGLYGSIQHEVIHRHPTGSQALNEALVFPALLVWVPYSRYRDLHLRHHRNDRLTDPYDDPESFYVAGDEWSRLAALSRGVLRVNNTLAGRLIIGPAVAALRFLIEEARLVAAGDMAIVSAWLMHIPALAILFAWIWGVCGISPLIFIAAFSYPGTALILLRSYAEHRAHTDVEARSVIVETCPAMALLFLNNNLHALHHARPGMAWYQLPQAYRAERESLLRGNAGYLIAGYRCLFARYFLAPKEPITHPLVQRRGDLVQRAAAPPR